MGTLSECALSQVLLRSSAKCTLGSRHDRRVSRQFPFCLHQKDNPYRSRICFPLALSPSMSFLRLYTKTLIFPQVLNPLLIEALSPFSGLQLLQISSFQQVFLVISFVQPLALVVIS